MLLTSTKTLGPMAWMEKDDLEQDRKGTEHVTSALAEEEKGASSSCSTSHLSLPPSLSIFLPNQLIRVHAFVFDSVGSDEEMQSIASKVCNYGDAEFGIDLVDFLV
jgi:hypothetical protein